VHGTGARDRKYLNCWGRIPKALEKAGAQVFYSTQDAWGSIEGNAETVKENALSAISETASDKINIIALSKGGLETRYMIHKLGMEDKVASLTTLATPHYGSKTMDYLCQKMDPTLKFSAEIVNSFYRWQGDKNPDFYNTCQQFTTTFINQFNREVADSDKVYYQSYASQMKKPYSDMLLFIQHAIVKKFDGECDGIVSVDSAKWGEFRGIITAKRIRGVSHADLRDWRRFGPSGVNIVDVYIGIVNELKEKGF